MKRIGLNAEEVEAKLRECGGNMAAVARHFGCDRSNIWHFCNKRDKLKKASQDIRESMKDEAEASLQQAVRRGEAWAVCFYLKCQAKDRGYIERQEIDHGGDTTLRIKRVIVDAHERGGTNGQAAPGTGGVLPV